jgi:hypothetical protein
MKKVYVNLQGGLGNQLFIYFHSIYIAEFYNKEIVYLYTGRNHLNKVGIHIDKNCLNLNKSIHKFIITILSKLSKNKFLKKFLYCPSEVGFDNSERDFKYTFFISGYFQTPKYLSQCKESPRLLSEIRKYIDEMIKDSNSINFSNSVGIHLRRGDYMYPKNAYFGVLSVEYYKDCILRLQKEMDFTQVTIFSDSHLPLEFESELRKTFENLDFINTTNFEITDVETLSMMIRCKSLAISNSTFAWWAAFLSGNIKVFCSDKWFKGKLDPFEIYPDKWIKIQSKWMIF